MRRTNQIRAFHTCCARELALEMDEEALVEAVRSFPCLWQSSSKKYKDLRAKENAWKEVAKEVRELNVF